MSRITHFKQQPKSVYYWDYYILCRLNVAAAIALQRMEYWDGTKDAAIAHAEADNEAQEANNQPATQDTSHWVYKAQDELQWELMGITGEKGTAALLNFLQDDVSYLAIRNNPDLLFDRKKQYEFQAERVQEHLDYLTYIISYFQFARTRLNLVYYAIELLTREGIYIEDLSITHVLGKLTKMRIDPKLPRFLKNELIRDKTLPNQDTGGFLPFRNIAEWKVAKLRNGRWQNCGMEGGKTAECKPQKSGSNSSNYNHSLQTVITNNKVREEVAETVPEKAVITASSPALPADLTFDEIALITKIIQEHRHPTLQEPAEDEPLSSTNEGTPTVEETSREASEQYGRGGKTSKIGDKQKDKRNSEVAAPSTEALVILDAWDQINGRPMPRTDDQVEAAEELARIKATVDDPKHVRDRLLAQKDGFWQSRGVSLKNVVNNFHLAAQGPLKPRNQATSSRSPGGTGNGGTTPPRKLLKRASGVSQDERIAVAQEVRSAG